MYDEQEGWAHRYSFVHIRELAVVRINDLPGVIARRETIVKGRPCAMADRSASFTCCAAAFLRDTDDALDRVCICVVEARVEISVA